MVLEQILNFFVFCENQCGRSARVNGRRSGQICWQNLSTSGALTKSRQIIWEGYGKTPNKGKTLLHSIFMEITSPFVQGLIHLFCKEFLWDNLNNLPISTLKILFKRLLCKVKGSFSVFIEWYQRTRWEKFTKSARIQWKSPKNNNRMLRNSCFLILPAGKIRQ